MADAKKRTILFRSRRHFVKKDKTWYRLDNAGKLYPSLISSRTTTLFRLTAELDKPINVTVLQKALNKVIHRFPYFKVEIRPGLFWYYLDINYEYPQVQRDSLYPCMNQHIKFRGHFPFRIRAYKNRISAEFSHVLTDGTGALQFLISLTAQYLKSSGLPVSEPFIKTRPSGKEFEDSFKRVYQKHLPKPDNKTKAFHLPHKLLPPNIYIVTTGTMKAKEVLNLAKDKKVSLTDYLTALLVQAYLNYLNTFPPKKRKRAARPIRVNLPVDLRSLYDSRTMRNFFLTIEPEIDPRLGDYTFDEILQKVRIYRELEVDRKYLNQLITRNVKGEEHFFLRYIPLAVKNRFIPLIYRRMAESRYSTGLSNLGLIKLDESMEPYVKRLEFIPPPSRRLKVKCAVLSYQDDLVISFGRIIKESTIEKNFFTALRKKGIRVKVETNYDPYLSPKEK